MTADPWADLDRSSAPPPDNPDIRTNNSDPASLSEKDVRKVDRTSTGQTPELAFDPDILGRFRKDLRSDGVAGEERLASLIYLAITSRVLPWGNPIERPVSVFAKGTTATGKSHTTRRVLRFFPDEGEVYIDLGSMSRRFLFYDERSYEHR